MTQATPNNLEHTWRVTIESESGNHQTDIIEASEEQLLGRVQVLIANYGNTITRITLER